MQLIMQVTHCDFTILSQRKLCSHVTLFIKWVEWKGKRHLNNDEQNTKEQPNIVNLDNTEGKEPTEDDDEPPNPTETAKPHVIPPDVPLIRALLKKLMNKR